MSERQHRDKLARLHRAKADLEKKRGASIKKAAALEGEAVRDEGGISKHTSESTARQKLKRAADKRKKAGEERERAAKLDGDIATKVRDIGQTEDALQRELDRNRKKDEQEEKKHQREEDKRTKEREQQDRKRTQADRKRRDEEKRHAREMAREAERAARVSAPVVHLVERPPPPKIKVLFLAASPEDQEPLRIDHEVREIQEKIRASEHRDSLELHWRPATRTSDLLQALNEVQPHIVHFSGHGSQDFLVFEDQEGNSKPLTNDVLASLLHATSDNIRLVIFNSCSSANQAELATEYVELAIGMDLPILDEAAKVFAAQFYSAIGFGLSVATAFDQAKVALELTDASQVATPALHAAEDVEPDEVVLVDPDVNKAA